MFIDVSGARLFFDTVGAKLAVDGERMVERPSLIVMHGGPGFDHSTLRPFFDRFADTHQVVYFDHRGNGRSTGAPETWTLAQWGEDVKALCDALGIVKPVVYGNSFGGMVAMAYASRYREHPVGLILSSTAARLNLPATFAMMETLGGEKARRVAERFWSEPDDAVMADYMQVCLPLYNPKPHPDEAHALKRSIMRLDVAKHFIMSEMRKMDALSGLARIQCPTLVLAGRHDPITPVECSREIASALPHGVGTLKIFDDAGHGVHRDDPEGAEAALRTFLGTLPSP